jgi:ATP-dependent RNA helicase DHX29
VQLISGSAFIDRRVKFRVTSPRVNLAMKCLRIQLMSLVAAQLRSVPLTASQIKWRDLAVTVLAKIHLANQDEKKVLLQP